MSYQVIARKWRPQQFDDVVGQAEGSIVSDQSKEATYATTAGVAGHFALALASLLGNLLALVLAVFVAIRSEWREAAG